MIKRDGTCTSLWQDSADLYESKNQPKKKLYDVAIAGGGITGITTALLLQNAGKKCIVFEAYNLCFGTTGGTTAHLNTLLDNPYTTIIKNFGKENAQLVAKASKEAIALVKKHIEEYKINCGFKDASAYLFAQTDDQVKELKEIHDACREVNVKAVYANELPVNIEYKKVMVVDEQAKFHPIKYVHALAKAFEDAGGVIVQQCKVENIEDGEMVQVQTSTGNFEANHFIYATHIPPGVNLVHLRCAPWRSYAMAVRLNNNDYPEDLFYDMYDPYHYIRSQKINNINYLITGAEDHKTGHIENTNECFLKLEAYTRKYFDVKEVAYKWSSQYFEPADALPYIGHLPGSSKNILTATGFGGNGMTYSHVAAIALRSIILDEENPYIKLFSPTRIKPVAGFTSFISQNVDVAKLFVGKWFGNEKLNELAGIAAGEGKVVRYEGDTIALYKDEQENLHALNPVCTHLKCAVAFNQAEQSWDCPCHGARYDVDGNVITAPANINLEKIDLEKNDKGV